MQGHRPEILAPLSDDEFNQELSACADIALAALGDGAETYFMPLLITIEHDKENMRPNEPIPRVYKVRVMADMDMDRRYEELRALGFEAGVKGELVQAAFFCAEAWNASSGKLSQEEYKAKYKQVADDPNKWEAVTIIGMTIDGRMAFADIPFGRGDRDEMIAGGVSVYGYGTEATQGGHVEMGGELMPQYFYGYGNGMRIWLLNRKAGVGRMRTAR